MYGITFFGGTIQQEGREGMKARGFTINYLMKRDCQQIIQVHLFGECFTR